MEVFNLLLHALSINVTIVPLMSPYSILGIPSGRQNDETAPIGRLSQYTKINHFVLSSTHPKLAKSSILSPFKELCSGTLCPLNIKFLSSKVQWIVIFKRFISHCILLLWIPFVSPVLFVPAAK